MTSIDHLSTLLKPSELAEQVGFSESTLATWRCRNRGPKFVRIMGRVYYKKQDVEQWLEEEMAAS